MKPAITVEPDILFSVGAVEEELEKIFNDPRFTESAILRKFLSFIVQETIHGRSNCLKEYTIAVNVLEKPLTFNPQENCIVRIHAGRLRRALNQYYNGMGSNDQIVISIPKGKYVPFFSNRTTNIETGNFGESLRQHDPLTRENSINVAVVPFICLNQDPAVESFVDGLCMRMSTQLMKLDEVSVIAYQAVKYLSESQPDLKEFGNSVGVNYVVTGVYKI